MKAILVIDDMPKSCAECDYLFWQENDISKRCCSLVKGWVFNQTDDLESGKCDICPLIEINDNIARLLKVAI